MRIIIDTGVFFHPEALGMLPWYDASIIVPSIVFAERARQLAKHDVDIVEFRALVESIGATIEPLDAEAAVLFTRQVQDDKAWKRLARDAMIAGHVRDGDRLCTTNPRDFLAAGVPDQQIVAIPAWAARERSKRR